MASKADTRVAILNLSKELGKEPPANLEQIDKMDLLQPLLDALEAEKAAQAKPPVLPITAGATEPPDDDDDDDDDDDGPPGVGGPPPPPTIEEPAAPKKVVSTTYVVNEGKMVTTKRGSIGALEHVWPKDFAGGQKDLDHWVTHGVVTKTEHLE